MGCSEKKLSKNLTQTFMAYCNVMICQQATLSGEAERPKVADAVIEAVLSIGIWLSSHEWLILSKQDLMSPSSIHCGRVLFESTVAHCSIASAPLRSFRNPYEFGSASVSAMGSRACRYKACMALSCIVGIPRGRFFPLDFGMYTRRSGRAL